MRTDEFVSKARKYAKKNNLFFSLDVGHGKGSHGRIYVGDQFTAIVGQNKTINKGLFHAMCKQLGIDPQELRRL
ncbi:MAG: hypothetical protein HY052_05200 [Proteobacteria bacterium]|nr:hypothetical protein [Pseudomonadota bacterium]